MSTWRTGAFWPSRASSLRRKTATRQRQEKPKTKSLFAGVSSSTVVHQHPYSRFYRVFPQPVYYCPARLFRRSAPFICKPLFVYLHRRRQPANVRLCSDASVFQVGVHQPVTKVDWFPCVRTDVLQGCLGWQLLASGRFAHTKAYLHQMAER